MNERRERVRHRRGLSACGSVTLYELVGHDYTQSGNDAVIPSSLRSGAILGPVCVTVDASGSWCRERHMRWAKSPSLARYIESQRPRVRQVLSSAGPDDELLIFEQFRSKDRCVGHEHDLDG